MPNSDFEDLDPEILQGTDPSSLTRGEFTVDWERAGHVLSRHALAEPHSYVLKWIQWGVRSGATEVRVEISKDLVSVEHDAPSQESTGKARLDEWYGSGDTALIHLTIGCYAVTQWRSVSLAYESGGTTAWLFGPPRESVPQKTLAHRITVFGVPSGLDIDGVPLLFQRQLMTKPPELQEKRSAWDFFRDFRTLLRPESALVRLRCMYAPVPVCLNGRPVNRPWYGDSNEYGFRDGVLGMTPYHLTSSPYYFGPQERCLAVTSRYGIPGRIQNAQLYGRDSDGRVKPIHIKPDESSALSSMLPHLGLEGRSVIPCDIISYHTLPAGKYVAPTFVEWVKDGVVVQRQSGNQVPVPVGLRAVVSAERMSTDASEFRLVKDDAYWEALDRLSEMWDFLPPEFRVKRSGNLP
jgi:hypothetical protein